MESEQNLFGSEDAEPYVKVAAIGEIAAGKMKPVKLQGRPIVVANVDGKYYAFADYCLHWGVKLSDGCLNDRIVRCRVHGWLYDIVDGVVVGTDSPSYEGRPIVTFDAKVMGDAVWVNPTPRRRT